MTIDVRPGIVVSIVLMVAFLPWVIDVAMSWSFLNSVPKEVIGFVYIIVGTGIGMLVDWFFSNIFPDDHGSGGM